MLLCFLLGLCSEAVICVIFRLKRLSMKESGRSLEAVLWVSQHLVWHWLVWVIALMGCGTVPQRVCCWLLCQGAASPAPLPSDFHVKAEAKQQWNRCNSAVPSNVFQHLNNTVVGSIPFIYCAGRWMKVQGSLANYQSNDRSVTESRTSLKEL